MFDMDGRSKLKWRSFGKAVLRKGGKQDRSTSSLASRGPRGFVEL